MSTDSLHFRIPDTGSILTFPATVAVRSDLTATSTVRSARVEVALLNWMPFDKRLCAVRSNETLKISGHHNDWCALLVVLVTFQATVARKRQRFGLPKISWPAITTGRNNLIIESEIHLCTTHPKVDPMSRNRTSTTRNFTTWDAVWLSDYIQHITVHTCWPRNI